MPTPDSRRLLGAPTNTCLAVGSDVSSAFMADEASDLAAKRLADKERKKAEKEAKQKQKEANQKQRAEQALKKQSAAAEGTVVVQAPSVCRT